MLAGSLSEAGYYMGETLYPGNNSNPKGFFEAAEIERINENLLELVTPPRPLGIRGKYFGWFYRSRPERGHRWLAAVPLGTPISCPPSIEQQIVTQTAKAPFCFKDPRFCYTLPAWRPHARDAVFLCIFREPARTVQSILKECRDAPYLHTLAMNFKRAVRVWTLMYQHVLRHHRHQGQWVFVHYDQVLDGSALPKLEKVLDAPVDHRFADPTLKRSPIGRDPGRQAMAVYRELCQLAGLE